MTLRDRWHVSVDPTAWVARNATVVGRVEVGPHASIWYSAVLRADGDQIVVGARSNLQDGAVVHADPGFPVRIGEGVSVGHGAIVHGCTIDDDVLVGMGAIVMDGAVIGAGSLIAAGSVVPQGAVIPPRSLVVGMPGKVVRQTSDPQLLEIRRNAETYIHLATTHRSADEPTPD